MALVEVIRVINGIEYTFQEDEAVAKERGFKLVDRSAPAEAPETPENPETGEEAETPEETPEAEEAPKPVEEPAPAEEPVKAAPKKTSKK